MGTMCAMLCYMTAEKLPQGARFKCSSKTWLCRNLNNSSVIPNSNVKWLNIAQIHI